MKVILYPALSLDGFIADKTGDSDWVTDQDSVLFEEAAKKAGCVVVGRKTFEQYQGDLYPIEGTFTIVVTSTPEKYRSSEDVVFMAGSVPAIMEQAEARDYGHILLAGGGEINGLFAKSKVIDEVIASIYPRIIGAGVRVFGSFDGALTLKISDSRVLKDGVVQNRYEVEYDS